MSLQDSRSGGRTIADGDAGGGSVPVATSSDRYIAPTRAAIAGRDYFPYSCRSNPLPAAQTPTSVNAAGQRFYPGNDPFSVLADLWVRGFGADPTTPQGATQYSVVPTQVGGGGGNTVLILLVLALGGVGVWYFYLRKKGES